MNIISKRWWMVCVIAIVLGVFAYSYFVNVQRDQRPTAEKGVAR